VTIKDMAREVSDGATGKTRTQFIALAKANGYEGHMGGWIYRTGATKPAAQGWAALAKRVVRGTVALRTMAEIVDAAHAEALDMNAATVKPATADAFHPGHLTPAQVGQAFVERVAEAKRRVAARTETIVATDIASPEIVARMVAEQEAPTVMHRCADVENIATAADFVMVRTLGGRAHIEAVPATAALCGESATATISAGALDLALVDCLACLDRYTVPAKVVPSAFEDAPPVRIYPDGSQEFGPYALA
jgi:hypothetical protein